MSNLEAIKRICNRYLAAHEGGTYSYKPFVKEGIYRRSDYRYQADLNEFFPNAPLGSFSYLRTCYETKEATTLRFALVAYAPIKVYVNDELQMRSDIFTERSEERMIADLRLKAGVNTIVLECEKTISGFGGEFGTWVGKLDYYFTKPDSQEEGVLYSDVTPKRLKLKELTSLPWHGSPLNFPSNSVDLKEVFPTAPTNSWAFLVSGFTLPMKQKVSIESNHNVWIDSNPVTRSVTLDEGAHTLVVSASIDEIVSLTLTDENNKVIDLTHPLVETSYPWVIAGPFNEEPVDFPLQYTEPFMTSDGQSFWRLQGRQTYLRIYNDNPLFGHWNYPLGVTLYGLVVVERMLDEDDPLRERIRSYLIDHLQQSIDTYAYALWDHDTLGGATNVHHLMSSLDSLDDCGSFGSTLLEIAKDHPIKNYETLVEAVGQYIRFDQARLEDGAFYRKELMHEFHNETMWVDDLYMSTPFLVRYSRFTRDPSILDDAVKQFLGFATRLYMSDKKLMSHVYDFRRGFANGVAWGRGNGWVLFSLSEVLPALSPTHPHYGELLSLFRNLSEGFLANQDEEGMFHQVLDMSESYQESSCTAMFASSVIRGINHQWYEDPEVYRTAAKKAVAALKRLAIGANAEVLGVCRGSEFSTSKHYYAEELLPRVDDTHGIGIILIALALEAGCD